ncbi:MAG: sulfotransferase [Planctomycetota bacterium]|nr:sulfotransferase [Planctomycetota bacterium]
MNEPNGVRPESTTPRPFTELSLGSQQRATLALVTGCYRSGTTLLEKLLHSHPVICIGSQPFPVSYFFAKQAFLDSRRLRRRYPLGHLFCDAAYTAAELDAFLESLQIRQRDIDEIFQRLSDYRLGHWTPEVLSFQQELSPGLFPNFYRQLHERLAALLGGQQALYCGSKEVLCEEFIPFVLARGGKVVLSVRDPRDMIASLDYGSRDNQTGDHRPLLFSLRAWRKSVAILLGCRDAPNFSWVRYEDVAQDPQHALNRLRCSWGVPDADHPLAASITGQDGKRWSGNSSFEDAVGITTASVGRFHRVLSPETLRYIEACCGPEMRVLGYELTSAKNPCRGDLENYREPFANLHAKFPHGYSTSPARIDQEWSRLQLLQQDQSAMSARDLRYWFVDPRAFQPLQNAVNERG